MVQDKIRPVRMQPPIHPSRISIPDFGSFRGKRPINAKYLRKTRTQVPSKPNVDRNADTDDTDTKSVVSSTETISSSEKTNKTKIDQYISELRRSMKATTLEQNHRRMLKPYSAWAVSNSYEGMNTCDDSIGDNACEQGIDSAQNFLMGDSKFQVLDAHNIGISFSY